MFQLGETPQELRPLISALGQEGLSHHALYAGREAGAPLLAEGPLAEALKEAERAARKRERELDGYKPRKDQGDGSGGDAKPEPDLERASRLVKKAIEEVGRLPDVALSEVAVGQLAELRGLAMDLNLRVSTLLMPHQPPPPEPPPAPSPPPPAAPSAPESKWKETSTEAAAAPPSAEPTKPPQSAEAPAAPEGKWKETSTPVNKGISFQPLIAAIERGLSGKQQELLGTSLFLVVAGNDPEVYLPRLREMRDLIVGAGAPEDMADQWLELLVDPDRERGGAFALWFLRQARLPNYQVVLGLLRKLDLPPSLRQHVEALRNKPLPHKKVTNRGGKSAPS